MARKKTPDFEEQMQRLHAIVQQLESMDLPLERSVALYKEGHVLAASCRHLLDTARNEVLLCGQEGMSEFQPRPGADLSPSGQEDLT